MVTQEGTLKGKITAVGSLNGVVDIATGSARVRLQTKTATPGDALQAITPDPGYDGLSAVTVEKIPENYGKISFNGQILRVE